MKIKQINISGFGKLNNLSIDFDKKINVIFGNNESGKSTLQTFIKGMFFSLKGGRKTIKDGMPDLKKYQPLDNSTYSGNLTYILDNSSEYLINRNFSSGEVKIFDETLKDISSEFAQNKEQGVLFAKEHLGLTPSMFENTCFIKQSNISINNSDGKNIIEQLSGGQDSSLDIISFKNAYDALNNAIKVYVGTDRTKNSPLDLLNDTLNELYSKEKDLTSKKEYLSKFSDIFQNEDFKKEDLLNLIEQSSDNENLVYELKSYLNSMNEYDSKMEELNNTLNGLKKQLSEYKKALANYQATLNEYKIFRRFSQNTTDDLLTSRTRLERLKDTAVSLNQELFLLKKPNFSLFLGYWSCLLLAISSLGLCIYLKNIIPFVFSGILLIVFFVIKKHYKKEVSKITQEKDYLNSRLSGTKREIVGLESVIETTLQRANVSSIDEFINNKSKYESTLNLYNSYKHSVSNCETSIEATNDSILNFKKTSKDNLNNLKSKFDVSSINKDLYEIKSQISSLEGEKAELEKTKLSLTIALDTLNEVNNELSTSFMPELNNKLGAIISKITNNNYQRLSCDTTFNFNTIPNNSSDVVNPDYLSGGTIDQIYLALRIALCEIVMEKYNESLPLIFDEVFATYDDIRTKETIALLNELSSSHQIILFTCKHRELELIHEICGDNVNVINL